MCGIGSPSWTGRLPRAGYLSTIITLLILLAGCAEAPPAFDDIYSTPSAADGSTEKNTDSSNTLELEKIFIDSVEKFWDYLLAVLKNVS